MVGNDFQLGQRLKYAVFNLPFLEDRTPLNKYDLIPSDAVKALTIRLVSPYFIAENIIALVVTCILKHLLQQR